MKLSSSTYLFAFAGVVILALIGLVVWGPETEGETIVENPAEVDYTEFAECIAESGAVFYHASWCGHCQRQKLLFGSAWEKLSQVQCDVEGQSDQIQECVDAGIEAYPTWIFAGGDKSMGVHPLSVIAEKTGCVLPE